MPKARRRENVLATLNWANVPPAASLVRPAKVTDRPPVCFRGIARIAHTRNRHIRPSHRHVATIAKRLAVMSNDLPQPQPPGSQPPTKPASSKSPKAAEN